MSGIRNSIDEWVEQGFIEPGQKMGALRTAGVIPRASEWLIFIDRLLLWGGSVMIAAAVIFFFAYNWQAMGNYLKFGIVQILIIASILCHWRFHADSASGKAALFAASLFVGVLFALFGQTYQTGADTYELFAFWALALLPWACAGRLPALWMLVIVLANLGLWLYFYNLRNFFGIFFGTQQQLWLLFALNTAALLCWEAAIGLGLSWLRERWAPRVLGLASGGFITSLGVYVIVSTEKIPNPGTILLVYLAWIGAVYAWYRVRCQDLFMLAVGVLSVITMVTTFFVDVLLRNSRGDAGVFLILGLIVIGLSAAGGFWLKTVAGEVKP